MPEVGALNIDLSANSAKFREGMASAKKALSEFEKSTKKIANDLKKFGKDMESVGKKLSTNLTLPIVAVGAAMVAGLKHAADYGDSIKNMSDRTGVSAERVQELAFAAKQTSVDFEAVQSAIIRTNKSMGDAITGSKKNAESFKALGVSITDTSGKLRGSEDVFMDVLDALSRVKNEAERNFLGIELMGKGYANIIPLIKEGKEGINKFAKEARDAGLVMSTEQVNAADDFGDAMTKLTMQFEHAGMELVSGFIPIIQGTLMPLLEQKIIPAIKSVAKWFNELSPTVKIVGITMAGLLATLGPAVYIFGGLAKSLAAIIAISPQVITGIKAMGMAFTGITGPVGIAIAAIAALTALLLTSHPAIVESTNDLNEQKKIVDGLQKEYDGLQKQFEASANGQSKYNAFTKENIDRSESLKAHLEEEKNKLQELQRASDIAAEGTKNLADKQKSAADIIKDLNITLAEEKTRVEEIDLAKWAAGMEWAAAKAKGLEIAVEGNEETLANFRVGMKNLQTEATIFGTDTLTLLQQKFDLAKTAMQQMIEQGINPSDPAFKSMQANMLAVKSELSALQTKVTEFTVNTQALWSDMVDTMLEGVDNFITGAGDLSSFGDKLLISFATWMKNLGKAMVAAGLASKTFQQTLLANPALAIGAGIALAVASQIVISSMKAPAFEQGGLVFGETLAIVGEGRGTSSSNPEVIAPLDKLADFIMPGSESGAGGQYEFIIRGETLRAVKVRNETFRKFGSGQ